MSQKIKIALADDEFLIRIGIRTILEQEDNFEVVFEASNGQELLDFLKTTVSIPDIILMDIKMPEINGIETTKIIVNKYPSIKIIALSSYNSPQFISNMLNVGAVSYLTKSDSLVEMIANINKVYENGFYFKDYLIEYLHNDLEKSKTHFDSDFLTKREQQILHLICKQKSSTEIADILKISSRTVDGHRINLLFKTDSKNTTGLVIFAIQNQLYSINDEELMN